MRAGAPVELTVALALALVLAGCGGAGRCPKPVVYDEATLKNIQKELSALSKDNILRSVMHDYEMERDDLRFCR